MKTLLILLILNIPLLCNAQKNISLLHSQTSNKTFFQGTKWFCCDYRKGRYKLFIKGNEITITLIYNEKESIVKGIIKNGKIYSNDELEKRIKSFAGKVYFLNDGRFHVLTSEGGEYDEYYECKQ